MLNSINLLKHVFSNIPTFVTLNSTRVVYLVIGVLYLDNSLSQHIDETVSKPLTEMSVVHTSMLARLEDLEHDNLKNNYYLLLRYKEKVERDPTDIKHSNILLSHNFCRKYNNYVNADVSLDDREFMGSVCNTLAAKVQEFYRTKSMTKYTPTRLAKRNTHEEIKDHP